MLGARGVDLQVVRLDAGDELPDPASVTHAITLGSEASADDPSRAWIATEREWLRHADRVGTPILGICFGAQLLAIALGGGVRRAQQPERGWIEISTTEPDLVAAGPWLSWHEDSLLLPDGAELLAHNPCGTQAYRYGPHLGLQFHPEVTPAIVRGWVQTSNDPHRDARALLHGRERDFRRASDQASWLFGAFIDGRRG